MNEPKVLSGRYEVRALLGRGGMAEVHEGVDNRLGRRVAIKLLRSDLARDPSFHTRLKREAQSAAGLNHPGIVAVYDSGEEEFVETGGSSVSVPFIVMEYVEGQTLREVLNEHGTLTIDEALNVVAGVLAPLEYSHRNGIVHRDIKPANVLIGGGRPKIGDFGIARAESEDHLTQTGMVTGTPSYMAPEVAVGRDHGEAADVWALGATIYFAVEGQDAHAGQGNALATLRHVATQPPRRPQRAGVLEPVLADMLAHEPSRRGTMKQALQRLENIAAGGGLAPGVAPVATPTPSRPAPARPQSQQRRAGRRGSLVLWAGVGLLVALLVAAAIAFGVDRGWTGSGAAKSPTASGATSSPATSPAPGEASGFTEDEGRSFIEDYFATVTTDREASSEKQTDALTRIDDDLTIDTIS